MDFGKVITELVAAVQARDWMTVLAKSAQLVAYFADLFDGRQPVGAAGGVVGEADDARAADAKDAIDAAIKEHSGRGKKKAEKADAEAMAASGEAELDPGTIMLILQLAKLALELFAAWRNRGQRT